MNEEKEAFDKLASMIKGYLDNRVTTPAIETINKDVNSILKLGSLIVSLEISADLVKNTGLTYDESYIKSLPKTELEKRVKIYENLAEMKDKKPSSLDKETRQILSDDSSKKYLLTYLIRELHWVTISILSASYISAHVLLRSTFELLIGISTKETGSMSNKVESIKFLSSDEKKLINKLWRSLCGWSHPYQKWEKEVCPIFISHLPSFHPKLCKESLDKLEIILGLFLTVSIEKYKIDTTELITRTNNFGIDISEFPILNSRI